MDLPIPEEVEGVEAAGALTAAFDRILADGFARLTPAQTEALGELAAALEGSALGALTREAVDALSEGQLLGHHLAVLAGARLAIEGARADALWQVAATATGVSLASAESTQPAPDPEATTRMAAVQTWLTEVALAGLRQLDNATIVPIAATLEGVQSLPELQGLAAMLTGFASELLDHAPTSSQSDLPLRRWADLWCQCMVLTVGLPEAVTPREVEGELRILGAEIRHHDHVVSLMAHGVLTETDGTPQLVRITLSAWKVDAVAGAEIWNLLRPLAPEIIQVLGQPKVLKVAGMTLEGGDLRWTGSAKPGKAFDPFAVDLSGATLTLPPGRDRHPIQVAVPQVRSACEVEEGTHMDGLTIHFDRVSPHSDYDPPEIVRSTAMVALLRYDAGWHWQPLAGREGKNVFGPAEGIAASKKVKKPALAVLEERSSRLLRRS